MKIIWLSRHTLTDLQLKLLQKVFGNDVKIEQFKKFFKGPFGLIDFLILHKVPVVCVAGAVHCLFAAAQGFEFYIFERDGSREFSKLYKVNERARTMAEGQLIQLVAQRKDIRNGTHLSQLKSDTSSVQRIG